MDTDLLPLSAMLADQETVSTRHYDQHRPASAPAGSTLRRRYGSWPAAVDAARDQQPAPQPEPEQPAPPAEPRDGAIARGRIAGGALASAVIGVVTWIVRRRR